MSCAICEQLFAAAERTEQSYARKLQLMAANTVIVDGPAYRRLMHQAQLAEIAFETALAMLEEHVLAHHNPAPIALAS